MAQRNNASSPQSTNSYEKILRVRKPFYKKGSSRRVSCKDLGNGDCEGWLWKKKEKPGFVSRDWAKFWFTLKEKSLYYYKNRDDEMAQGIFQMPAFTVSYTTDKDSSRKFAFKFCHEKHGVFLFASERKEDMVKWMNTLQLACLPDFNPKKLAKIDSVTDDFSESDSEDGRSNNLSMNSSASDCVSLTSSVVTDSTNAAQPSPPSPEEPPCIGLDSQASELIHSTLRSNGRSIFESSIKRRSKADKVQRLCSHLASLQRTLKDKEMQLNSIEEFLGVSSPITSEQIQIYRATANQQDTDCESTDI